VNVFSRSQYSSGATSGSTKTRVNRDDLLEVQADGTEGSAVAGLRECHVQDLATTPKPVWDPDQPKDHEYQEDWAEVPDNRVFENAFKQQWEEFIRHVVADEPFPYDFRAGVRGVQMAELGYESWSNGERLAVPALEL